MTKCDCGSEEFFIIDTTPISEFWYSEYNEGFERLPNLTIKKKAVCVNCLKFLKEEKYLGKT
jgi:hypothetical protein